MKKIFFFSVALLFVSLLIKNSINTSVTEETKKEIITDKDKFLLFKKIRTAFDNGVINFKKVFDETFANHAEILDRKNELQKVFDQGGINTKPILNYLQAQPLSVKLGYAFPELFGEIANAWSNLEKNGITEQEFKKAMADKEAQLSQTLNEAKREFIGQLAYYNKMKLMRDEMVVIEVE